MIIFLYFQCVKKHFDTIGILSWKEKVIASEVKVISWAIILPQLGSLNSQRTLPHQLSVYFYCRLYDNARLSFCTARSTYSPPGNGHFPATKMYRFHHSLAIFRPLVDLSYHGTIYKVHIKLREPCVKKTCQQKLCLLSVAILQAHVNWVIFAKIFKEIHIIPDLFTC